MRFFRNKKRNPGHQPSGVPCKNCGSPDTRLIVCHGTGEDDYVRVWRGQRLLTFRCNSCGQDFYSEEPPGGFNDRSAENSSLIDDEDSLKAAEHEIEKQIRENDDRRCW